MCVNTASMNVCDNVGNALEKSKLSKLSKSQLIQGGAGSVF